MQQGARVRSRLLLTSALLAVCAQATGQTAPASSDWQELDVPPAPAFSDKGLLPLDMPASAALKFGVDPTTLVISKDGVVRYVVVATSSSGARNVMYEGIRCVTGEVKTYARQNSSGQWVSVAEPSWRPLHGGAAAAHALALARQGACSSRSATADSVAAIIKKLRQTSPDPR